MILEKSKHLDELEYVLLPSISEIQWLFHVSLTYHYSPKDEFLVEKDVLEYLTQVGDKVHRKKKEMHWFFRVEEHESKRLHVHLLMGARFLLENDIIRWRTVGGKQVELGRFLASSWKKGMATAVEFIPYHLEYVTKRSGLIQHCGWSKAVRQSVRRGEEYKKAQVVKISRNGTEL